jgi:hypothetical protein
VAVVAAANSWGEAFEQSELEVTELVCRYTVYGGVPPDQLADMLKFVPKSTGLGDPDTAEAKGTLFELEKVGVWAFALAMNTTAKIRHIEKSPTNTLDAIDIY